jgi:hypothetical protein
MKNLMGWRTDLLSIRGSYCRTLALFCLPVPCHYRCTDTTCKFPLENSTVHNWWRVGALDVLQSPVTLYKTQQDAGYWHLLPHAFNHIWSWVIQSSQEAVTRSSIKCITIHIRSSQLSTLGRNRRPPNRDVRGGLAARGAGWVDDERKLAAGTRWDRGS